MEIIVTLEDNSQLTINNDDLKNLKQGVIKIQWKIDHNDSNISNQNHINESQIIQGKNLSKEELMNILNQ